MQQVAAKQLNNIFKRVDNNIKTKQVMQGSKREYVCEDFLTLFIVQMKWVQVVKVIWYDGIWHSHSGQGSTEWRKGMR